MAEQHLAVARRRGADGEHPLGGIAVCGVNAVVAEHALQSLQILRVSAIPSLEPSGRGQQLCHVGLLAPVVQPSEALRREITLRLLPHREGAPLKHEGLVDLLLIRCHVGADRLPAVLREVVALPEPPGERRGGGISVGDRREGHREAAPASGHVVRAVSRSRHGLAWPG